MENSVCFFFKEIFNYKLIYNFTLIQTISIILIVIIIFQFTVTEKLNYVVYLLCYLNITRMALNYEIITSNRGFFIFNCYMIISFYLVYFFRKELKLLREREGAFSKKLTDITYGKLFDKHLFLNYIFFFRNCFLFILDNMFNLKNIKREKLKGVFLMLFSIICINLFGSYEFLYITIILTYLIESEKKKYKNNIIYKKNFEDNARFFQTQASRTIVGSNKINYYFVQKAGMFSALGKAAAENPKTVGALVTLATLGVGVDGYLTYDANQKIEKHNTNLHSDYTKNRDKITEGNIDVQKEYAKAMRDYSKNSKGNAPLPPTYISEPQEPVYKDYKQTMVGQSISVVGKHFPSTGKES